jgi:exonuclease III
MKILEWNVNCKCGNCNKGGLKELSILFQEKPKYEIIILTEFYRLYDYKEFNEKFMNWGYETFITPEQNNRNDVFIAVSKELDLKPRIEDIDRKDGMPDILAVTLKFGEKDLVVVGVRFYGDYQDMFNQFIKFLSCVNCCETIIIGGDFNNAKIHGDENTIYTERQIDSLYSYGERGIIKKYVQFDYNYHRIKLWLSQNRISLITPKEGFSYHYRSSNTSGNKIDHFATRGININNVVYLPTSFSDHNQLIAELEVN